MDDLAESEALFRDLADRSADVVWRFVMEPFPHFDYISPSIEKILGYHQSVFMQDFTAFVAVLDDEGRQIIGRALAGEMMPHRRDFRFRHIDGSSSGRCRRR